MTRAQHTISIGLLSSSVYLALYMNLIPLPNYVPREIIPVLPFWILVSIGSYLLAKLGLGLLTFNDVPDAHKELLNEIEIARRELRILGVDVD
ncbi:dolichol phosphate mannosyltransferase subunit 3 [Erysiphe neolycopersici]|uniref:Dolichol-phosphate mannosyltransferase subunit 3 n=1 Tax=Erysiphe neolycopersici TaxID=212602 RepID=A0A420HS60_9PEZI|nr:dolichol phosphate mannosyltransferase subunit 3 [Erysiphe neolycopersici]